MGLMDKRRELIGAKEEVARVAEAVQEQRPPSGLQYRVEQVRETLVGDKVDPDAVQALMNQRANEGWRFVQAVEANVKGRVGPGGVEGLLLIFERAA